MGQDRQPQSYDRTLQDISNRILNEVKHLEVLDTKCVCSILQTHTHTVPRGQTELQGQCEYRPRLTESSKIDKLNTLLQGLSKVWTILGANHLTAAVLIHPGSLVGLCDVTWLEIFIDSL